MTPSFQLATIHENYPLTERKRSPSSGSPIEMDSSMLELNDNIVQSRMHKLKYQRNLERWDAHSIISSPVTFSPTSVMTQQAITAQQMDFVPMQKFHPKLSSILSDSLSENSDEDEDGRDELRERSKADNALSFSEHIQRSFQDERGLINRIRSLFSFSSLSLTPSPVLTKREKTATEKRSQSFNSRNSTRLGDAYADMMNWRFR